MSTLVCNALLQIISRTSYLQVWRSFVVSTVIGFDSCRLFLRGYYVKKTNILKSWRTGIARTFGTLLGTFFVGWWTPSVTDCSSTLQTGELPWGDIIFKNQFCYFYPTFLSSSNTRFIHLIWFYFIFKINRINPPSCTIRSSGMLGGVGWCMFTEVLGQLIDQIF